MAFLPTGPIGFALYRDVKTYPRAWALFQPECKGAAYTCPPLDVVKSYDNSIRYTDHVLGEAIDMLRAENAILFFHLRPRRIIGRAGSLRPWLADKPCSPGTNESAPSNLGIAHVLTEMRGGLTAEEYRWKLIRQYLKK